MSNGERKARWHAQVIKLSGGSSVCTTCLTELTLTSFAGLRAVAVPGVGLALSGASRLSLISDGGGTGALGLPISPL